MRGLTLEERISRLERLLNNVTRKNEFLDAINKPKRSDEKEWVSKLFSKYPSLKRECSTNINTIDGHSEKKPFYLILKTRGKEYNGMYFLISTHGDRGDMYCTAFDKYDAKVKSLKKFHLDKELNQCAMFILQTLQDYKTNEGKSRFKNENVSLTTFDCETIKQMLDGRFDDLPEIEVDVADDNSDYGFINIGIYNPEYITSYDLIVNDAVSVDVEHDDKKIGTSKSIEDATDMLADHFMEDYVNGKYNKKKK